MAPRIQLIHAVSVAQGPIHGAFARLWPEARIADLTEASLAADLAGAGELTDAFTGRMAALIGYGVEAGADGVMFTCSAFGAAIKAARDGVSIPVLKPDEAMIEAALSEGPRIGGLATFAPTIASLAGELAAAAGARGLKPAIDLRHVPGAMEALQLGRGDEHDALIAEAAAEMTGVDVLILAQFSMSGARDAIAEIAGRPVLTAPDEAVKKLRRLLGG
ncbi:MAG: arylsulfatase [Rhodospirillaceae bacterium]|jgi:Asp/Glu/hydantoin racemase|nr:arylsulfatase [Rhodospirillaceae bacterium]|tara:strand:- start:1158 stop:1814 length:657 start_codon:yes stop_codon:yes gene_type:complete